MPIELLYPDDVDTRSNWPPGRASRLCRAGKLPHYILPDGSIRLRWEEIVPLIQHIDAVPITTEAKGDRHDG